MKAERRAEECRPARGAPWQDARVKPDDQRPWSTKIPAGPWDVIVIGSGMGGMTAAALLSRLGQRVLVLEQHYTPGGFTHSFKRPGYAWDVGVHAVGEVSTRSFTGRLLARLTGGRLRWASLGPVYDEFHFPDGFRIDFPDSPQQFRQNLRDAFPREDGALDRYFGQVREVTGAMRRYYLTRLVPGSLGAVAERLAARDAQRFFAARTADVLAGLTEDARLRAVLAAQWGYYGAVPSRSSFAIHALVVKHFLWGAYYPVGGSGEIARELLRTVADAGGWTAIRANVGEIVIEGGRAVGVRLQGGDELRARRIISAAGVASTVRRLLPAAHRDAPWARSLDALAPAPAHVCLYLGFKGDIRKAGAGAANQWLYETWSTEEGAWDVHPDRPLGDAPVLYCSFPSLKDPTHDPGPEERHTGEVVTFVPWSAFSPWQGTAWHRRGADYDAFKERLRDRLLAQLARHRPALAAMVDYAELSTPLSTDHFCRPIAGSIYGLMPTPERFRSPLLRPHAPIANLFFAGSDVATVGVMGAMMGGVLAAVAAEPALALSYVRSA